MHPAIVQAYATMLPRLQAEEQRLAFEVAVAAIPGLKDAARQKILRRWDTAIQGGRSLAKKQPIGSALAALGIPVKRSRKAATEK